MPETDFKYDVFVSYGSANKEWVRKIFVPILEKAGLKVKLKKTSDFRVPEEFQKKLDKNRALKEAFDALTPGRQRAYIFHFSQPKQSKTREARVEKYIPQILDGKGLND